MNKNKLMEDKIKQILFIVNKYTTSNSYQMKIWSSHLLDNFKQLSHEPEKFRWLNGIRTHDLCDAGAVL